MVGPGDVRVRAWIRQNSHMRNSIASDVVRKATRDHRENMPRHYLMLKGNLPLELWPFEHGEIG